MLDIFHGTPDRDLKPFLLTVYEILPEYKNEKVSLEIFLNIIQRGLVEKPGGFDPDWLDRVEPPTGKLIIQEFSKSDSIAHSIIRPKPDQNGLQFTYDVLKFQTAELTKMTGKQLNDSMRYFGLKSETDHQWYNFTAKSVLECGVACKIDHKESIENLDWSFLGSVLENGRIYE